MQEWLEIKPKILAMHPEYCGFDTETTGLHIICDKPFLFQFGFIDPTCSTRGFTFLVDLWTNPDAKDIVADWHHSVAEQAVRYIGANIKFDLHMLSNISLEYTGKNTTDIEFYIRYGCDAIQQDQGGPPLALKEFAAQYIDINAKYHERLLHKEQADIAKQYNAKLKKMTGLTIKQIDEMFKDPIFEVDDLPMSVREPYLEWKATLPQYLQNKVVSVVESDMIRYDQLNPETLKKYAHLDIVYTLEIFEALKPVLEYRGNQFAVELEESNIEPLLEMERSGLLVDKEYLEASRKRMRAYILQQRKHFLELCGEPCKVGQHQTIKRILRDRYGLELASTGSQAFQNLHIQDPELKDFIGTIEELRSLEKWYSTYIIKFQQDLKRGDRIYTQIKQVGTVSGRVSCDFQQFPKEPLLDKDGNELFHPRKMILKPDDCKCLLFLDYSAEELRVSAMYTVLVGNPDINMLRAYMPYKCIERDGKYYLEEQPDKEWEPVDLHAATTIAAGISPDDPNFKHYRKTIGKRLNFSKSYGASYNKVRDMFPEKTEEECHRIDEAYYKAFPGLKTYHQYCFDRAKNFAYTSNMFGVRYYHVSGHKLRNVLVQGTCAHFLKGRIRAVYDFLKANGYESKIVMQIHDELMFEIKKTDPPIAKQIKAIMEDWPDAPVPIVAEAEATQTNWAEKKEVII